MGVGNQSGLHATLYSRIKRNSLIQKKPMYEMHKYWGKKPSDGILNYILKYSEEGQTILDPFSGYGVIVCEAFLNNRNVISNDLNPISNFINKNLFEKDFNEKEILSIWDVIRKKFVDFNHKYFSLNNGSEIVSILRDNRDIPLRIKYQEGKKYIERDLSEKEKKHLLQVESEICNYDWYPSVKLIENSRISAKKGMYIEDLFTKRELVCHARLLKLINSYSKGVGKSLLLFAFSANLANCSKLVPPIKSRGQMSQGAWMTGFYIGKKYIENNVLHYFENRLKKIILGKKEFVEKSKKTLASYKITNYDCKNLSKIEDGTVDYIITDPPYGETVPYFEQSVIWNSWLNFDVHYENEIVVSNSWIRSKDFAEFDKDIKLAYSEISRVLKEDAYFTFTFHSLSGKIWNSIVSACILNNFSFIALDFLKQKTLPPRQINRKITPQGDLTITLQKKKKNHGGIRIMKDTNILKSHLSQNTGIYDTNTLYGLIIKFLFENKIIFKELDILRFLHKNYILEDGKWKIK